MQVSATQNGRRSSPQQRMIRVEPQFEEPPEHEPKTIEICHAQLGEVSAYFEVGI